MLTPQEVAEHAFNKATFGGYNMAMVDEFLDQVTADYTALFKENAALKAKMKVLADKVEEYRSTEEAMRKALMSAQKMADQLVAEAEAKKANIVAIAEAEARDRIDAIRQEVANEEYRLTAAQNAVAAYMARLKELYRQELENMDGITRLMAPSVKTNRVDETVESITSAVEKTMEGQLPDETPAGEDKDAEADSLYEELTRGAAVRPLDEDEEDEDDEDDDKAFRTRRLNFENLKFGKDYEIE